MSPTPCTRGAAKGRWRFWSSWRGMLRAGRRRPWSSTGLRRSRSRSTIFDLPAAGRRTCAGSADSSASAGWTTHHRGRPSCAGRDRRAGPGRCPRAASGCSCRATARTRSPARPRRGSKMRVIAASRSVRFKTRCGFFPVSDFRSRCIAAMSTASGTMEAEEASRYSGGRRATPRRSPPFLAQRSCRPICRIGVTSRCRERLRSMRSWAG